MKEFSPSSGVAVCVPTYAEQPTKELVLCRVILSEEQWGEEGRVPLAEVMAPT